MSEALRMSTGRAARAGNSALTSRVTVKIALARSFGLISLRRMIRASNCRVALRIASLVLASTVVAPRTPRQTVGWEFEGFCEVVSGELGLEFGDWFCIVNFRTRGVESFWIYIEWQLRCLGKINGHSQAKTWKYTSNYGNRRCQPNDRARYRNGGCFRA